MKQNKFKNNYLQIVYKYIETHKKQTRMTMACIIASICMITSLFSLADIGVDIETQLIKNIYGNYHIKIDGLSFDHTDINKIDGISHGGWIFEVPMGTYQNNDLRILCGDADIQQQFGVKVLTGRYAETETEAVVDKRAIKDFGLEIGDDISVNISGQIYDFSIVGICDTFSSLTASDTYGLLLATEKGKAFVKDSADYYITCDDINKVNDIKRILIENYGIEEDHIQQNEVLLAAMGHGKTALAMNLYLMAGILFCLVFLVSFLMITNCLNISTREKAQLYGLTRCIGATSKQLRKCVKTEGKILWRRSIPIGVGGGIALTWICLLLLKTLNKDMFGNIQVLRVSLIGIIIGVSTGLAAVMLAAKSPAKYACKVPPIKVVNSEDSRKTVKVKKKRSLDHVRVELLIGFRQAVKNKKSFALMVFSFAMNIVLIVSFSVMIDFIYEGSSFTKPYNPDVSIYDKEGEKLIEETVKTELKSIKQIKNVVGRKTSNVAYKSKYGDGTSLVVSYDEQQFQWIQSKLVSGKLNITKLLAGEEILVDEESGLKVGDEITFWGKEAEAMAQVGGILRNFPYDSETEGGIRCLASEKLFQVIEGDKDYSILDINFYECDETTWNLVTEKIPDQFNILDYRQSKEESKKQFITMAIFVYGFCGIILSIVIFNIINCMGISVWNNMKKYGVICSIGGTKKQCQKIVIAEALLYSCGGGILGMIIGIPIHYYIYTNLVSEYFNTVWRFPIYMMAGIIGIVIFTTIISAIMPLQKVKKINAVEMLQQA